MILARAALLMALFLAAPSLRAQPADASDVAPSLRAAVAAYRAGDLATAEGALRPLASRDADAEAWLGAVLVDRGRTREAQQVLQHAASAGSAEGAHRLALLYASGADGLPRNDARALELFEKAASQGHVRAEINAGTLYLRGQGTAKDLVLARAWLEKAAARNDPYALYALGRAMEDGQGAALPDPVRAADLYRRAAQQGHTLAALRYGLALGEGNGVRQDLVAAQAWLVYAEKNGVPEAALAMGDLATRVSAMAARDKAASAKALQTAITWYNEAAQAGVASAQFKLATAYLAGTSVARNPQQAQQWYTRAASQGLPVAEHALGLFLIGGANGTPDPVEGYKWLLVAERGGFPDSQAVREKAADKIAEPDRRRAEALAAKFTAQPERPFEETPPRLAPPPAIRP
jgi:TPR repeat protein